MASVCPTPGSRPWATRSIGRATRLRQGDLRHAAATPTPDFWKLFGVLLVISMAVTSVVSAALDTLVVRLQERRRQSRPTDDRTAMTPGRADRPRRALVHH
ncbi:hypothetical protein [Streptomyces sviceus]|uniref:hypothetical protein n=1 Tax=Streptomyces sviceus TaxID=285530 RepID=UPI0036E8E425